MRETTEITHHVMVLVKVLRLSAGVVVARILTGCIIHEPSRVVGMVTVVPVVLVWPRMRRVVEITSGC